MQFVIHRMIQTNTTIGMRNTISTMAVILVIDVIEEVMDIPNKRCVLFTVPVTGQYLETRAVSPIQSCATKKSGKKKQNRRQPLLGGIVTFWHPLGIAPSDAKPTDEPNKLFFLSVLIYFFLIQDNSKSFFLLHGELSTLRMLLSVIKIELTRNTFVA